MRRAPFVIIFVSVALAACGSSTKPAATHATSSVPSTAASTTTKPTGTSGLSGKTPAQVLAMASTAALAKGSAHLVEDIRFGSSTFHLVADVGTTQGKQALTSSCGIKSCTSVFLVQSAQTGYLQGNAVFYEQNFTMSPTDATKYAGKWIAVPSSTSFYKNAATGLTMSSLITIDTPSAPLRFTQPTIVDGQHVVGVSGALGPDPERGVGGTQVLYISTVAPYLPVACVIQSTGRSNGKPLDTTDHMSDYGEPVTVTAPANSIPFSSVPGLS